MTLVKSFKLSMFGLGAALSLSACSGGEISSGTRTLTGRVDVTAYALDNARVVATASNQVYLGAIGQDGRFRITIPKSGTFRLSIANSSRSGLRAISALTFGSNTQVRFDNEPLEVSLGVIRPRGTTSPFTPASKGSDDSSTARH